MGDFFTQTKIDPISCFLRFRASVSSATWLDAQHPYMVIAQRAVERPALHVVVATAVTAAMAATRRIRTRLTLRR